MKKSKKLLIGISVIVGLVAVVIVAAVLNKGHRVIKVESLEGEVTLEREQSEEDIFKGMNLKSQDTITTGKDGLIGLLADEDKHIAAIENTCFSILSSGNKTEGMLKIELEYGSNLIEIENKLSDGSSFEVETPNAALSVRGTIFSVTYTPETNTTILMVTEGAVWVDTGVETATVNAGENVIITDTHIEKVLLDLVDTDAGYEDADGTVDYIGVSIGREEWPELLKGDSNFYQLEYLLEIASLCEYNGNTDYIKTSLYWMGYAEYSTEPYVPISTAPEVGEKTFDVATLNKLYSFLTDETIGEEHLNSNNRLNGNEVVCAYVPTDHKVGTSASIIYAYYEKADEISVEYNFYLTEIPTATVHTFKKVAHLMQDEDGKYVLDYIETIPNEEEE